MPALPVERLRSSLRDFYVIDRELGRGGMATLYLAQDCKHDRSSRNGGEIATVDELTE